jgi:hypothetical protein
MGKRIITLAMALIFVGAINLMAQDVGNPDTLRIDSVKVMQGGKATVNVDFYNDEELAAIELPIIYSSADISIDSISYVGSRVDYLSTKIATINNPSRQAVTAVFVILEANISPGNGLFCKIYFNIPAGIPDQKITIDTAFYPPGSQLTFIDVNAEGFAPIFKIGKIIVGNPLAPPEINVTPDSLYFEALAGGPSPVAQTLSITNLGEATLRWTATKKSSWLSVTPSFGVAPSVTQVFANATGLPVGYYYDTVTVSDTNAINDPFYVPVVFRIMEPPPTIHLSPNKFNFNAIADSSNPPSQTLTVTNIGYGTLNWSAANSSSWLEIYPTSGVDSGNITLSVDVAGLPYGTYYDTVVVSDPNATNNPQKAAVKLEVASDLPVIAVDSPLIFVVVDVGNPYPANRQFYIYNAGAGSMNFELTESSPRILSLTPDSGAAPQTVVAGFKTTGGSAGMDYLDTVWISSPEAINSPQFVVFHFHYVEDPAEIALNTDSIVVSRYECSQGMGAQPPATKFSIFNYGTDPMTVHLEWTQPWLALNKTNTTVPSIVTVTFYSKYLSVGTHYDTIVISAINAINSPVYLPVKLNILPTPMNPLIYSYADTIQFYAQENKQGQPFYLEVNNYNPGCMEWQLEENIGWLSYSILDTLADTTNPQSQNVLTYPWSVQLTPFANVVLGTYNEQAFITSPTASNSPYPLIFKFQVWRFYGDCDYNGVINAKDITYLINYLFRLTAAPKPHYLVGDCDCSNTVNALDVTALVSYLFQEGDPLCGNPY